MPHLSPNGIAYISGYTNYLNKFSPLATEVCELLEKLKSVWTDWHRMECTRTCRIIKKDTCMNLYDKFKSPYLEIDESSFGLGAKCEAVPNCFCHEKSIESWVALQQYRIRSTLNTTWPRDVPPLLFCKENMHHHLLQIIGGNNQQGCGYLVPSINSTSCCAFISIEYSVFTNFTQACT